MWFGILTPGEHECRPVASPGQATLYCWNDIARIRIDGPYHDVAGGLRMLRASMEARGQMAHDARCFTCGAPYSVPEPVGARAGAQDLEPLGDDGSGVSDDQPVFDSRDAPARFVLVHLDDVPDPDVVEEALVVVPDALIATLVPLDAVSRMLEILAVVLADAPHDRCGYCDATAPAVARGGEGSGEGRPNRRERRRHAARGRRRAA